MWTSAWRSDIIAPPDLRLVQTPWAPSPAPVRPATPGTVWSVTISTSVLHGHIHALQAQQSASTQKGAFCNNLSLVAFSSLQVLSGHLRASVTRAMLAHPVSIWMNVKGVPTTALLVSPPAKIPPDPSSVIAQPVSQVVSSHCIFGKLIFCWLNRDAL